MEDEKVFNCRLSRARRIIGETVFGILCAQFSVGMNIRIRCYDCYASYSFLHCLAQFSSKKGQKYSPPRMMDKEDEHVDLLLGFWRGLSHAKDLFIYYHPTIC